MSKHKISMPEPNDRVIAEVSEWDIRHLEGEILTLIETLGLGEVQEKAIKGFITKTIWGWSLHIDKTELSFLPNGDKLYTRKGDKEWYKLAESVK